MDIDQLVDIFPHIPKSEFYKLRVEQCMILQEVIDTLLVCNNTTHTSQTSVEPISPIVLPDPQTPTLANEMAVTPTLDIPEGASVATILDMHADKVIDVDNDVLLTMTRACILSRKRLSGGEKKNIYIYTRSEARFARLLLDCELSYCFHWVIVVGGRVHEWCKKGSGIL